VFGFPGIFDPGTRTSIEMDTQVPVYSLIDPVTLSGVHRPTTPPVCSVAECALQTCI